MGKNIRWIIVLLLFLVYMINYLDRVALSITVPMIEKDLALNAEQFGIIFGSFFFGYAVFNFIGGLAVDKFGATLVMGLGGRSVVAVLRLNRGSHRLLFHAGAAGAFRDGGRPDLRIGEQDDQRLVS